MKNSIKMIGKSFAKFIWIFGLAILFSCEKDQLPQDIIIDAQARYDMTEAKKATNKVVEVVTTHMDLEMPASIASGWTTFRYLNNSHNPHFFLIQKLPGDKTVEDSKAEVVPVFQEGMDFIGVGDWDNALTAFGKLPAWSAEIIYWGGVGLLSPNEVAESTVYLEPGNYAVECYVKNSNGVFHSYNGMITGLVVTSNDNGYTEPKPTMEVSISSTEGIKFNEKVRPGKHMIEVIFEDQTVHEHFLGHDVHLVKLDETANIADLNAWMNWADPNAFKTPAPQGVEFLGGMQELPALEGKPTSAVGYFEAHLKPGTYAFIAEVPDPMGKNMFKVFTVPF